MGECFLYGNGGGDGCTVRFTNYMPLENTYHWQWPNMFGSAGGDAATTLGNKAFILTSYFLDVYTEQGVHTSLPNAGVSGDSATTVGDKAMFVDTRKMENVHAFTESGVHSRFPGLRGGSSKGATTVGGKGVFAGGNPGHEVDAFTKDGLHTAFPDLQADQQEPLATTVGSKALIGWGGTSQKIDANIYGYTEAGTQSIFSGPSGNHFGTSSTTIGGKGLFAEDYHVYAFTESGTYTLFPDMPENRDDYTAATVGGKALFAGGYSRMGLDKIYFSIVDAYTEAGVHTNLPPLVAARSDCCATTVGNKAVFAGGYGDVQECKTIVEAYSDPASLGDEELYARIHILPSGAYQFDGLDSYEREVPGRIFDDPLILDVPRPVNGYIKYKGAKYSG